MGQASESQVTIQYDILVPMSDGACLALDTYRPTSAGPFPVILVRTAYGKSTTPGAFGGFGLDLLSLIRDGYVAVVQDVRGTGGSTGTFSVLRDDGDDGFDTIAWIASQPWCDGNVGMAGGSYLGCAQLQVAPRTPPALRAITPFFAAARQPRYQGGAFLLGNNLPWYLMMALADVARWPADRGAKSEAQERLATMLGDVWSAYRTLPLLDLADITPWLNDTYGRWLRDPMCDECWHTTVADDSLDRVEVPALHVAGWNDIFLKGSLETFGYLREHAATAQARDSQHLIVTPWGHSPPAEVVGDIWYGPQAGRAAVNVHALHAVWFDTWLRGAPGGDHPPVRLFVGGLNRWRNEMDWPLARAAPTAWYLHEDGSLSPRAPGQGAPDEFRYDPCDPVPTVSGQNLLADGGLSLGPRDRRTVQQRPDVLVYTSDVLQHDVEVTGPVTATLQVATSALDTDFTAALIDVHPDGRAIGLTDGILRLRYRDGHDHVQLSQPDQIHLITIDLVATSNVFLAGHRIAVEISSSNFPRFDRNPNHGGVIAEATESDFVVAKQRIYHDSARASYITLPIVAT